MSAEEPSLAIFDISCLGGFRLWSFHLVFISVAKDTAKSGTTDLTVLNFAKQNIMKAVLLTYSGQVLL